jgi:competence protein ComEC
MPAVVPTAFGFAAGLAAGLLLPPALWALAPASAALALVCWRRWPGAAIGWSAAAAGMLWAGGAAARRTADCRLHWRDGERLSLIVEPRDLDPPARLVRVNVLQPVRCRGTLTLALPRPDTVRGLLAVSGTWQRDVEALTRALPPRPERAGRLFVLHAQRLAGTLSLRSRLRIGAERRLALLFGPEREPLAAALSVSPDVSLDRAERDRFARSGLAHLLSISGFHVALLAAALLIVLRGCGIPPRAARVVGTVAVALYVWMLGFPAPALRAAALLGLWSWARLRQRPPVPQALVATSALAVLAVDPWALLEAGAWLSFSGVWGCLVAARWWQHVAQERRSRAARRWLRRASPVAVTVGAVLATAPVTLLAFGTASPAAIVANLGAVPLAAFAVPALALALAVAPLWHAAAATTAAAAGLALDGIERVAATAAALPWAQLTAPDRTAAALAALAAAFVLLGRLPAPGRRSAVRALLARSLLAAGAAAACAACVPIVRSGSGGDRPGVLTIHFLSVGQGDAAVLHTPGGRWIVIDGGPRSPMFDAGARRVVPFLRREGAGRVAVLVASHGDADHLGGLPAVLGALPTDLVLEPGQVRGGSLYLEWLGAVFRDGARWHPARAGERLDIDGVALRVVHPDSAWLERGLDANENSVVLVAEFGKFRAVFPGDAGLPMEVARSLAIGDVTLLKVGHHGSRSATGPGWLAALRPEVCVVSVGPNHFGHPTEEVLARLADAGCATWRTDRAGDVTVETDGRTATVRAADEATRISLDGEHP